MWVGSADCGWELGRIEQRRGLRGRRSRGWVRGVRRCMCELVGEERGECRR